MIKIDTSYIDNDNELTSKEFRDVLKTYLQDLTENSKDKDLLDEQTTDQIVDLTYKYNTSLNATFFSNNLMPRDLYDNLKFLTWRLHSSEKITTLIEIPDNINLIRFSAIVDLFFPQLFELRKIRKKKNIGEKPKENSEQQVSEDNESLDTDYEIDDIGNMEDLADFDEFSFLEEMDDSSEKLKNLEVNEQKIEEKDEIPVPGKGGPYSFRYNGEGFIIDDPPITGPLKYIKMKLDVEIDVTNLNEGSLEEFFIINENLKDTTTLIEGYSDYNLKLDTTRENVCIKVEAQRIKGQKTLNTNKLYLISFALRNLKKIGKSTRRKMVFKKSIICPLIKIDFHSGKLVQYVQKLSDLLETFHWDKQDQDRFYKDQKLIKSFTHQVNCILTYKNENSLFITPFGVYDQLKFYYDEIEMNETFDSLESFKQKLYDDGEFSDAQKKFLENINLLYHDLSYIEQIFLIFKAIKTYLKPLNSKSNPKLRTFQWVNTIWRIKYLIEKLIYERQVENGFAVFKKGKIDRTTLKENLEQLKKKYIPYARIVKAPTGAGKTLVFFIDSLLHFFFTKERCVIIFPTRLLNLEMFQNLTMVIYSINKEIKKKLKDVEDLTAGLYIGKTQFNLRSFSKGDNKFSLIPRCPECRSSLSFEINLNDIPECNKCHHKLDYVYTPYKDQINHYIPDILVATPDKIFWDLFIDWRVASRYGNFGTLVIKCPLCKKYTSFLNKEQNKALKLKNSQVKCMNKACQNLIPLIPENIKRKLIGLIILDEIHSISGLTGIFLSKLLKSLKFAQKKYLGLEKGYSFDIEIETGTATIAEEESFIKKLVEKEVSVFPKEDNSYHDFFKLQPTLVRYRILVLNTIFTAIRRVFSYANLYSFKHYFVDKDYETDLVSGSYTPDSLNLGCAYVYRKDDGYASKKSIINFSSDIIPQSVKIQYLTLSSLKFISGNSEQKEIIQFLKNIESNNIALFLANQVVSLGLNIKDLNRMILLGTPKSMNEQVQTIGRIGRAEVPGFATILLYPNLPRDDYLYENFHFYFLNCNKLFEPNPIQNFNLFITEVLTPNLFLLFIYTNLEKDYLLKLKNFSNRYWLTSTQENRRVLTNFILEILSGSGPEFSKEYKEEIFIKIRQVLIILENAIRVGGNEFLNQILDRNNLIVKSMRRDSGQVGIYINETNKHFTQYK